MAFDAPARSVIVVWGQDDRVPAAANAFAARSGAVDRLRLVRCERHAEGLSRSLSGGLKALDLDSDGAFIFLADMPRIPSGVCAGLSQALSSGAMAAAPTYAGRRGHPVLFVSALYPDLCRLSGDRGGASVLAGLGAGLVLVPAIDDGVLFDVDRPQDLEAEPGAVS